MNMIWSEVGEKPKVLPTELLQARKSALKSYTSKSLQTKVLLREKNAANASGSATLYD
jgi:hypothetical protein